jgi:hypothetical protein
MKTQSLATGVALPALVVSCLGYVLLAPAWLAPEAEPRPGWEERSRAVAARFLQKERIVDELAAERLTLRQAARAFRDLHADDPVIVPRLRREHPGRGAEEFYCWWVIRYARARELDGEPGWDRVIARLEAELRSDRDRGLFDVPDGE